MSLCGMPHNVRSGGAPTMLDLVKPTRASKSLDPTAVALLMEIRSRAEAAGGECSASAVELGKAVGVTPRHAVRLIRNLEREGWIVTTWTRYRRWASLAPGVEAVEG